MKIEKWYKLSDDTLIKYCANTKLFNMNKKYMVDYDEVKEKIQELRNKFEDFAPYQNGYEMEIDSIINELFGEQE